MPLFQNFLQIIEDIVRNGGLWFVFIIAVVEALPFIGAVIPGHTFIILAGFLSFLGIFDLPSALIIVSLGAVVGDAIGYFAGKKFGMSLISKYGKYFYLKEGYIEKSKELLNKHAGKALILGRFSPITRAFMPFFAGIGNISQGKFWFFNSLGGILWASASVMIGYIAGMGYQAIAGYIGHLFIWGFVYAGLLIWAYVFLEKREHLFHRKHLWTLILAVSSFIAFMKFLQDAFSDRFNLSIIDVNFNLFISQNINPILKNVFSFLSYMFNPEMILIYSVIILAYLLYKRHTMFIYFYCFTLGGGFILGQLFKNFIGRSRPFDLLISADGYSFPSSHALIVIILMGTLSYFVYRSNMVKYHLKSIVYAISFILVVLVSFSRLYLMVHWLTDVLAGLTLGIFWLTFSLLLFHVLGKRRERCK